MRIFCPDIANRNLAWLNANPYPGRGIVVGVSRKRDHLVQVYWIMGRSENSRNRVFKIDGGRVFTEAADPLKVADPSLIIYNAMVDTGMVSVVSNGSQTDMVAGNFHNTANLAEALSDCMYEPDDPNFTPRITAVCRVIDVGLNVEYGIEMALLRKSLWGDNCDECYYFYRQIQPGFGFCITTYSGDGKPLPDFTGEPLLMPLGDDIDGVLQTYWDALNEANRVALAVKFISLTRFGENRVKVVNKITQTP